MEVYSTQMETVPQRVPPPADVPVVSNISGMEKSMTTFQKCEKYSDIKLYKMKMFI